jgi:hypothetical protein
MSKNKYDVQPSTENKGLVYRAKISEGCTASALKEHLAEVERVTKAHLAVMADAENRDIHVVTTANGLVLVGPSSGELSFPFAKAFNASIAVLDAKIAELDAKLAALSAAK